MDQTIKWQYYQGSNNQLDDKDYNKIYEDQSDTEVSNLELLKFARIDASVT